MKGVTVNQEAKIFAQGFSRDSSLGPSDSKGK